MNIDGTVVWERAVHSSFVNVYQFVCVLLSILVLRVGCIFDCIYS